MLVVCDDLKSVASDEGVIAACRKSWLNNS